MNRILLFLAAAALCAGTLMWHNNRTLRSECARLREQREWFADELERSRSAASVRADSNRVLRLRCAEFERLRAADARRIRDMGIRLQRLEAAGTLVARHEMAVTAPARDTIRVVPHGEQPRVDSVRLFRWSDRWCRVEGVITADSVACRIESVDTLRQIIHRVPRRFLFIRWGTRCLRQEIRTSNPHHRIVYSEWIRIER